jgi:cytochrome c-type biogenesis protein CcmH/NrfG
MRQLIVCALAICVLAGPALAQVGSTGHGGVSDRAAAPGSGRFDPSDARNPISMGLAALDRGDFDRASDLFDEALATAPDDPDLLTLRAMAMEGRKNYTVARQLLVHAIRVDHDNLDAHRELGLTYAGLRNAKGVQTELAWLKAKLASCPAKCEDPAKVKRALDAVEAVASPAPAKAG